MVRLLAISDKHAGELAANIVELLEVFSHVWTTPYLAAVLVLCATFRVVGGYIHADDPSLDQPVDGRRHRRAGSHPIVASRHRQCLV